MALSGDNASSSAVEDLILSEFDAKYYFAVHPDLAECHVDPIKHYVEFGWLLDYDPTAYFSTSFYLDRSPDVRLAGVNPYYHYLKWGRAEGRAPNQEAAKTSLKCDNEVENLVREHIDSEFYFNAHPELLENHIDPVKHYISFGAAAGYDPHPDFSTNFYLNRSPDVRRAGTNPFFHYLKWGKKEGRAPNQAAIENCAECENEIEELIGASFDIEFYLRNHPELIEHHVDPIKHYSEFGWRLGYDPSPDFSTLFYIERSPDVKRANINPFFHYLKWGAWEGRAPNKGAAVLGCSNASEEEYETRAHFDVQYYLDLHPEISECYIDPVKHYMAFGWRQGFDPTPDFSTHFYIETYADSLERGPNPFFHYLSSGRDRGRLPHIPRGFEKIWLDRNDEATIARVIAPWFDAAFYTSRYQDIRANNLDPLTHYVLSGWKEGRDPAPWFSTSDYLGRYPDVAYIGLNPLFHFVVWGKQNGFETFKLSHSYKQNRRVGGAKLVKSPDLRCSVVKSAPFATHRASPINASHLKITWVIPDFNAGGGGHMTIFRMVKWLEIFGHTCSIKVINPVEGRTNLERIDILLKNYQIVRADIDLLGEDLGETDVLIATSWETAYVVSSTKGVEAKFYFVQDYEPLFYPMGSFALAALETYKFDLACICASPWLKQKVEEKYGKWARSFFLAADENYRFLGKAKSNAPLRIAFYARMHTARRAVELGLLALELLAENGESFVVDFFGSDMPFEETPFESRNWGILDSVALNELYNDADIGICFSSTNYSLVPQEMMVCKLPVVEIDTESVRSIFPDGVVALAGPSPMSISTVISDLLKDETKRELQASKGFEWAKVFNWEGAARTVERAIIDRIGDLNLDMVETSSPSVLSSSPFVSVVIPTFNGGDLFQKVLATVLGQLAPWPFEVVVIDSSSTDGTWDILQSTADPRLVTKRISKGQFQHGRTRNLGCSIARGEYIAFITQDALPKGEFWLYNLVTTLIRFPRAAGVFGSHIPWPSASPYVKRDLQSHFASFLAWPLVVSKYSDIERWKSGDLSFRQFLHYYSDNNSCLRRSTWERIPYPEVDYGEDQLWARDVISRGYWKAYAPQAIVFHSHEYDEIQTFERARTEARFFKKYFGYNVAPSDTVEETRGIITNEEIWGVRNGVSTIEIEARKRLIVHHVAGLAAGSADVEFKSAF